MYAHSRDNRFGAATVRRPNARLLQRSSTSNETRATRSLVPTVKYANALRLQQNSLSVHPKGIHFGEPIVEPAAGRLLQHYSTSFHTKGSRSGEQTLKLLNDGPARQRSTFFHARGTHIDEPISKPPHGRFLLHYNTSCYPMDTRSGEPTLEFLNGLRQRHLHMFYPKDTPQFCVAILEPLSGRLVLHNRKENIHSLGSTADPGGF